MSIENILEAMSASVEGRFNTIRKQHYNPNVKGGGYEKIVRSFLEAYLAGRFAFYERCSLLDTKLLIGEAFTAAENEWDVVGTFRNTIPSLVLEREGAPIVPYDAVALIVAVKQTLTQDHLEKDLNRFSRLLDVEYESTKPMIGGAATVDHPLRILFYYEGDFSTNELVILQAFHRAWDIAVSYVGESFLANRDLAFTQHLSGGDERPILRPSTSHVLPWLLLFVGGCSPQPLRRDTCNLLLNLLKRELADGGSN